MDREFKIVISIFSFILIYGLGSLARSQAFETPIFFNQIIFLIVAIVFWLMNRNEDSAWVLVLLIPVHFISCLIDPFIMGYLYERQGIELAKQIFDSNAMSWLFVVVYFGYMFLASQFAYKSHKKAVVMIVKIILLIGTIIFLLKPEIGVDAGFTFFAFLILFFFTVNRLMTSPTKVLSVLSHQFLLILLLEGLEYFH